MPHYRLMFDREYLGHFDLPNGDDLTLTIKRVIGGELVAMGGRKSKKPIVHFQEEGIKPLICNVTNAKTIATMYGNMTEGWLNKRITLFVSTTRSPDGSGEVECIRIRPQIPTGSATARSRVPAEPRVPADDIETVLVAPRTESATVQVTGSSPGNVGVNNVNAPAPASAADPYLTPEQQIQVSDECRKLGRDVLARLLARAKVGSIAQMPASKYQNCLDFIAYLKDKP